MARLRDITPRGLYARSLLIILAPVLLILSLMTWYYYSSHIAEMNRKLGQGLGRDAALIREACLNPAYGPADYARIKSVMETDFTCALPADALPAEALRRDFPYSDIIGSELVTRAGTDAWIGRAPRDTRLFIRFPVRSETGEIVVDRKRALVINAHFFMVWVIVFSLLMVALAIGFLNQQVRSILRLSEAARAFGRGRDLEGFRPSGATEVRDAARAIIDMKNRLTAFTDQRTAMLAGVSHDLRTPLTRLKLTLALMPQTEDLKDAQSDLDDMAMMLDEYLAFARGEDADEATMFDLGATVQEIAEGFGPHVPVSGPASLMIRGRPLALKRALTNLVSNALKYASSARITVVNGPHWAEVAVDDDGPGIPPERYEEAFRPFSRLDEARSQNASGSGLGLTLARDTARSHGGDVRLAQSPLGGLRAILRIPH